CLRPSCTAMVCPTISGVIVERRDHVRITRRFPRAFISSTFFFRWPSTNGPFFKLRGICYFFLRFSRRRTMNLLEVLRLSRVRRSGLPQGVDDGRPPDALPSPPPSGWSTGFIATPRTFGRRPFHRLRPALPIETSSCSGLPTCPMVALQPRFTSL